MIGRTAKIAMMVALIFVVTISVTLAITCPAKGDAAALSADQTPPTILSRAPAGSDISPSASIRVTFSEPMNRSSLTITGAVLGLPTWSTDNTAVAWTQANLVYSTSYTLTLDGKDLAGNSLVGDRTIVFSTLVKVTGLVTDQNGMPVAGANLSLTMPIMPDMAPVFGVTGANGSFSIVLPMSGTYNVKVTKDGFDPTNKVANFGPGMSSDDLGSMSISQTNYYLWMIAIIVVIVVIVLAFLVLRRRK